MVLDFLTRTVTLPLGYWVVIIVGVVALLLWLRIRGQSWE